MINTIYHRVQKPWAYPLPKSKVGLTIRVGKNTVKKITIIYGDPMGGWTKKGWKNFENEMQLKASTEFHDMYEGTMLINTKRYRYAFEITTKKGKTILYGENGILKNRKEISNHAKGFSYSYWNKIDFLNTPDWYRQTSWYQIFPDRFARHEDKSGNNIEWNKKPKTHEIYGGDIKGIINKLPHIKSLGFDGIYLTPIFSAQTSHKYETNDYNILDHILGSEKDFKNLVQEAHKLGIKIMLDGVFNHIGYHSRQFQDVIKNKEKSEYKDWFWINDFNNIKQAHQYKPQEFDKKYPYETFAIVPEMPRLNWKNEQLKKYLFEAIKKWTMMGIDGWRLDVSFEPPIDFWRQFNKVVKDINKDIAIIGEVWWDSISYIEQDIWHGIMNYPLRDVIMDYVISKQTLKNKKIFVNQFNALAYSYTPEQQWGMMNLMSSHDVPRLITLLKNNEQKYKLAMEMCFLQPGAPSTYYGEEIGLEGQQDPDNRRTYPWDQKLDKYFKFFKSLNKKRLSFVNTSDIYSRFVAKLDGGIITLENSTQKIIIKDYDVEIKRNKNATNK